MTQPEPIEPKSLTEVADEHRVLREALERVEATTDLVQLVPLLADLREQLEHHFAEEEAPDGLALTLEQAAPQNLRHLDRLFEGHRRMLHTTTAILERAQALLDGPKADLLRDIGRLGHDIRAHEATETALITDSVFADIGSGD